MRVDRTIWVLGAALFAWSMQAEAQTTRPQLHEMNFDMWCQEHQHLPPSRCDKRLPDDDAAFESYVDTIEHYETQQLNGEAKDRRIDRMIDRADPIDHPIEPSAPNPPQH